MNVRVGQKAPDFTTKTVLSDNSIIDFNLHSTIGKKFIVLLFYPLDFTFVCPTEIIAANNRIQAFEEVGAEPILISVDSHFSHIAWKNTPLDQGGIENIQLKMLSDLGGKITKLYGAEDEDGGNVAYRATFIIDKKGIIRHLSINDLPIGRNIDEILRLIEAIDFADTHGEVCPASWKKGKNGMKATQKGIADFLLSNKDKI